MGERDSIMLSRSLMRPVPAGLPISNKLLIRSLVLPAEAEEARHLLNQAYAGGEGSLMSTDEWLASLLTDAEFDPELCLGAFDREAGGMLGVIQAWNTGFIKDLGVRQTERRSGVGRALVEAVCERLRARKIIRVSLKVVPENHKALQFYDALGFEPA